MNKIIDQKILEHISFIEKLMIEEGVRDMTIGIRTDNDKAVLMSTSFDYKQIDEISEYRFNSIIEDSLKNSSYLQGYKRLLGRQSRRGIQSIMQWQLTKDNNTVTVNYISDAVIYHRKGYKLTAIIYKDWVYTDKEELKYYERKIEQSYF